MLRGRERSPIMRRGLDWSVSATVCLSVCLSDSLPPHELKLKRFMKVWKPSSPKKSKEPSEVPRCTSSSTTRPRRSRGTSRFQPEARMLYHLALSEHSCAARKSPKVFWSRAWTDKEKGDIENGVSRAVVGVGMGYFSHFNIILGIHFDINLHCGSLSNQSVNKWLQKPVWLGRFLFRFQNDSMCPAAYIVHLPVPF